MDSIRTFLLQSRSWIFLHYHKAFRTHSQWFWHPLDFLDRCPSLPPHCRLVLSTAFLLATRHCWHQCQQPSLQLHFVDLHRPRRRWFLRVLARRLLFCKPILSIVFLQQYTRKVSLPEVARVQGQSCKFHQTTEWYPPQCITLHRHHPQLVLQHLADFHLLRWCCLLFCFRFSSCFQATFVVPNRPAQQYYQSH